MRSLFARYAARHLSLRGPGFPLLDSRGGVTGYVDWVEVADQRLRLRGWTRAEHVALIADGNVLVRIRPNISRGDVLASLPDLPSDRVGFELEKPADGRPALICIEMDGLETCRAVPPLPDAIVRSARWRLVPRFILGLLRAAPALVRWALWRDLRAGVFVREALGLVVLADAMTLDTTLFDPRPATLAPAAPVTIILPVYNAFALLPEVLGRVVANTDCEWRMVLVEDASPDPAVRPWLRKWAAEQGDRVELLENAQNLGFIGSVNRGMARAVEIGQHVILLNSDAMVPPGWASRLTAPILNEERVASVTPMSNDAEIFSVPVVCQRSDLAPGQGDAIDRAAQRFGGRRTSLAPTGVGFCMAISMDYLRRAPAFDTAFGRGYGEEVDWCQRIRSLGGRHLGLPGLFVEHRGGASFGSTEKLRLITANGRVISRRYPGYDHEVQEYIRTDPLITPRLALAVAWAASGGTGPLPVYLAHGMGGGAENYLQHRIAGDLARAGGVVVLRVGGRWRWTVEVHSPMGVVSGGCDDIGFVAQLLDSAPACRIVYSCGVGDRDPLTIPDALLALRRGAQDSLAVLVHDYFMVSPSYCLLDAAGAYRGVPGPENTDAAHRALRADGSLATLAAWQEAWGRLLAAAAEVVVFSDDSRDCITTAYPGVAERITIVPHALIQIPATLPVPPRGRVIGVLGNIGYQKGAAVVAEMGRALGAEGAARIVILGQVDPAYAPPPWVAVHGGYRIADLPTMAAQYGISDWLIPSIWRETFSFTMHEALATGLPVHCFDLGAQAEAARRHPNGRVIPFGADGKLGAADLASAALAAILRPRGSG